MSALDRLRTIADQATPGPWAHGCLPGIDPRDNRVYATQVPDGDHPWTTVLDGEAEFDDAGFIATFDPSVVLALLDVAGFLDDFLFGCEDPNGDLTDANLGELRDRAIALADRLREAVDG